MYYTSARCSQGKLQGVGRGDIWKSLYILLNFSMSISCSKNKVSRNKNKCISKRKQAEILLKDSTNHKRGGEIREWGKEKEMNSIWRCQTGWNYLKHGWYALTAECFQRHYCPPCQLQRILRLVVRKLPWVSLLILSQVTICP